MKRSWVDVAWERRGKSFRSCFKFLHPQDTWLSRKYSASELFLCLSLSTAQRGSGSLETKMGSPESRPQGWLLSLFLSGTTCLPVRAAWSQAIWVLMLWAQRYPTCSLGPHVNFNQDTTWDSALSMSSDASFLSWSHPTGLVRLFSKLEFPHWRKGK